MIFQNIGFQIALRMIGNRVQRHDGSSFFPRTVGPVFIVKDVMLIRGSWRFLIAPADGKGLEWVKATKLMPEEA